MTTTKQRQKIHLALLAEKKLWTSRRDAALASAKEQPDIEAMQEALRDYHLAKADCEEFDRPHSPWIRVYRQRANSEHYRRAHAMHLMAERLLAVANQAHTLSEAERKAEDAKHAAESKSLQLAIEALLRSL